MQFESFLTLTFLYMRCKPLVFFHFLNMSCGDLSGFFLSLFSLCNCMFVTLCDTMTEYYYADWRAARV